MSRQMKFIIGISTVLFIFLGAWFWLDTWVPAEGDGDHIATGKGLYLTGKLVPVDFDSERNDYNYSPRALSGRGYLLDETVCFFYKIKPGGIGEVMWVRLTSLMYTLLSFALIVGYGYFRLRMSANSLIYLSVLFLGQSMIMEQALYIRFYSLLLLFMEGVLICYWEAREFFINGKKVMAGIMFLIGGVLLGTTIFDQWQYEHLPILIFAVFLSFSNIFNGLVRFLYTRKIQLAVIVLCILIFAPFLIIIGEELVFSKIVIGSELTGITFSTYWDNMMSLLRSSIALNVCWIGVGTAVIYGNKKITLGFGWWVYFVGIFTVIIFALLMPINCIYYGRYSFLPVVLTVIGFGLVFEKLITSGALRKISLIFYLLFNIFLSFIVFNYERSNIIDVIGWLKKNINKEDIVLIWDTTLGLNGGDSLKSQAFSVNLGIYDEIKNAKNTLILLNQHPHGKIYYLFHNYHDFRDKLYTWMTGDDREVNNDFVIYLDKKIPHENPFPDLRGGAGLDLYDRKTLVDALNGLVKNGFPPRNRDHNISMHKNIMKAIFRFLHLPDKREDIEKKLNLPHYLTVYRASDLKK